MDQRHVIGKGPMSSSPARGSSRQGRHDYYPYRDQGPSSSDVNSYYRQDEGARYLNRDLDGLSRFENLENCRSELLQKLDELKDHLSRSCEVTERPSRQRMGTDMMISPSLNAPYPRNHVAYAQEGFTSSHGVKQPLTPDDMVYPHISQAHGFVPYNHTYSSSSRDLHSHRGYPHEYPSYADTHQQEMSRGPYGQPQSQYLHRPYHERHHGDFGNVNRNLLVVNPDENFFHKTTCPCVQCYDKNWDLPAKVDPSGLYNQRSPHVLTNPNYHHPSYPIEHEPQGYRSGGFNLHNSHSQPSITPNSTEQDFDNDGINQYCLRKTEEAHRKGHMLHPFAGGAPFIACSSCFELLRLPRKHISLAKSQQKLKCGACSSIILFELGNKALTVPVSGTFDHVVTEMDDHSSVTMDENVKYEQGGSNIADTDVCSDLNDGFLPKVSPADKKSGSDEFEKQLDPLSSASSPSKDQKMSNTLTSEKYGSSSAELHVAEVESFPIPIVSAEEGPDHCSAKLVVGLSENGNEGKTSELDHSVTWQNSGRDSAVSTEIDMSSKEFSKSLISQDSLDKSRERHITDDKGAESSSAHPVKSSSGDFKAYEQNVGVGTWQNSVRDSAVSTEIDMSSKEFSKSFISQDSLDNSRERHITNVKGAESSSARPVKSSSGDFKAYEQNVGVGTWQNSVRDSAVSTEIDMSSKEFPKSYISQDSVDKSRERHLQDDKGAESSSAGPIKNSSGNFKPYQPNIGAGTSQVFVNGHLIPEHLVQNAELLAGPIQPGEYWYDMHAGFWGVMGYPCLGIIMPNIEEFNYPMPEDCAAGNTEVFVNGRELHQKDLDLLAGRGLPRIRDRSYIVEISGEVVDEDTGEELDSIGKLAPTVERAKHGFGMKVPNFIARLQG